MIIQFNIEEEIAISDEDKAEMFWKEFTKINSSDNLSKECKEMREKLLREYPNIKEKRETSQGLLDVPFTQDLIYRIYTELKRALKIQNHLLLVKMELVIL